MKRILTGTIFGALLIGTILLRNVSLAFFDCFIGLAMVIASYEMCNALAKFGKQTNKYVAMCYPVFMYCIYLLSIKLEMKLWQLILCELATILVVMLVVFIVECISLLLKKNKDKKLRTKQKEMVQSENVALISLKRSLNTLISIVYPCVFMGIIIVLSHIKDFNFVSVSENFDVGFLALALLFTITCVTDIFAFVVGSVFKGPKLCPLISPKKTIAGAVGGVVYALIGAIIVYFCFSANCVYHSVFMDNNISVLSFILIAFVGSIFSQLGDIFASYIKRKAGIKDYGNILPGHGGILDRFDGVIFNAISILCFTCIYFL